MGVLQLRYRERERVRERGACSQRESAWAVRGDCTRVTRMTSGTPTFDKAATHNPNLLINTHSPQLADNNTHPPHKLINPQHTLKKQTPPLCLEQRASFGHARRRSPRPLCCTHHDGRAPAPCHGPEGDGVRDHGRREGLGRLHENAEVTPRWWQFLLSASATCGSECPAKRRVMSITFRDDMVEVL